MVRDTQSRRRLLARTALTGVVLALGGTAAANPVNPTIVHGDVGFAGSGSVLEVRQGSDKAIIDWRGFDIAAGETTRFVQPGSGSIALNRVGGNAASVIDGSLTANGRIFVINPNGILFGAGASVDVGGLVATTADIANDSFLAGDYRFDGASTVAGAAITNNGVITAGMAVLVAPQVRNGGTIQAGLGRVTLGAAQRFTLDMAGDGLISFDAGSAVAGARLEQAGLVQGATVLLSAATAARVVDNVIDMTGVVEARGVRQEGGDIVLDGGLGVVSVAGTLDASSTGGSGGTVQVQGDQVAVNADLTVKGAFTATGATSVGNGVTVSGYGSQTYTGSLSLAGHLVGAGAGAINVSGRLTVRELATIATAGNAGDDVTVAGIDGPGFLAVDAGAGQVSLGTVGAAQTLAGLSVGGAGIALSGVTTTGLQDYAGAVVLNGNLVSTAGGSIRLGGPVTLAGDSTIVTAGNGGDDINVSGTVNGAHAFQIDAGSGTVTLGGAAGGTTALKLLAAGGSRVSLGDVTTTGLQDYAGTVTLNGNLVSMTGGSIRAGGPVTLTGNSAIVTAGNGGDDIRVGGAVDGAFGLLLDAGQGDVALAGAVGGGKALTLLSTAGRNVSLHDVRTTGQQDHAGAVTLAGNLVSEVGGAIRIGGPLMLAGNSAIVTAGFASDAIHLDGAVNGAFSLIADAGAGTVVTSGTIGGSRALSLFAVTGSKVALGDVTTTGRQDYAGSFTLNGNLVSTGGGVIRVGGPLALAGDSAIVTAGFAGDDIDLAGSVNGAHALMLDAGAGKVAVAGAVGGATALKLFSAGGATVSLRDVTTAGLQDYAGAVTLSGNLVSLTGGAIRAGGPLALAGDSAIVTAGGGTDDIRLAGSVDGAYALVIDAGAGNASIGGAVGATQALRLLSAGGSTLALRGVKTVGQQDYAGAITLNGDLTSTGGGIIRLAGPVTLAADSSITTAGAAVDGVTLSGALAGPYRMTIRAGAGNVGFGGAVSGLTGLDVAGGAVNAAAPITVAGNLAVAAARLTTAELNATNVTLTGTDALTSGAITAGQDVKVTAGKAATLGTVTGRGVTVTAGDALTTGAVTATQDVSITGAKAVTLGAVSARNLTSTSGAALRLAGIKAESAVLTGTTAIAGTGPLNLSRTLLLDTSGAATGLDVWTGALTYRGTGRFSVNGTVAGVSGPEAADLVQIMGPRSGSYLFGARPVFGIATLADRHRLDIAPVDTVPADDDGRTDPPVLDPASVKDDLISFQD